MSCLTKIDPSIVVSRFTLIAKAFKCQKCFNIPLNPVQCTTDICGRMTCFECLTSNDEDCNLCKNILEKKPATGNVTKILGLIEVTCSYGCNSVFELKDYKTHSNVCQGSGCYIVTQHQPNPVPQVINKNYVQC